LQAQQLIHLICYPTSLPATLDSEDSHHHQLINRVLQNLDQWSLRVSYLELKLLLEQASSQAVRARVLATINDNCNNNSLRFDFAFSPKLWTRSVVKCK
jgi:hypothetical protein